MTGLKPIKIPSAKEKVASELRKAILSRKMQEGENLSLESVASQLNVSITPVREAFQILARDGLIKLRPNKGAIVLGVTDTLTIKGCLDAAEKYGKKVFVDMICVKDIEGRVAEIEEVGVNCIGVHVGVDLQAAGVTPMDDLKRIKAASKHSMISVAGGINVDTVDDYKAVGADIVIVGGGLNHAEDPVAAAKAIYEKVHA